MQKFRVDISSRGAPMVLYAAQGDTKSRFFSVAMFDSGVEYSLPSGAHVTVRFGAPGMPAGWYDTITEPDGGSHPAISVDGHTITVELAEQAVSVPGKNRVWLLLNAPDGYQLASWGFDLVVEAVHGMDAPEATVYYNALAEQVAQTLVNAQSAASSAAQAQQYAESINTSQFATATQGAKADTAVQSVNGRAGTAITLTPTIIGAATAAQGALADSAVQSVNGHSGRDIALTPATIGAANASDVLSLEEIQASTDLTGKIASASALGSTYKLISSIFSNNGRELTSNDDMNNITEGVYRQGGPYLPLNAPSDANNAYILVVKRTGGAGYYINAYLQIWASINSNAIFIRWISPGEGRYMGWIQL